MIDNPLRSPIGLRWNRDINAGDLRDLHCRVLNPFYTRDKGGQDAWLGVPTAFPLAGMFEGVYGQCYPNDHSL
jgi:hypothetical protein